MFESQWKWSNHYLKVTEFFVSLCLKVNLNSGYITFHRKERLTSINVNEIRWIKLAELSGGDSLTQTTPESLSTKPIVHIVPYYNGLPQLKPSPQEKKNHVLVWWL